MRGGGLKLVAESFFVGILVFCPCLFASIIPLMKQIVHLALLKRGIMLSRADAPLEQDVDVTGPIVLKLYASSTAIDTQFIVKLTDQHPQDDAARKAGTQPGYTPVAKGWLKASHREKDEKRSKPERPFYTHTNPQPLEPGKIYEFDIEVLPVSYVFKAGHRIRLEIVNGDSSLTDAVFNHPYHPTQIGRDTIHHDGAHASCLLLPVVAA
jgi:putative CocE/NonD family hydrolase